MKSTTGSQHTYCKCGYCLMIQSVRCSLHLLEIEWSWNQYSTNSTGPYFRIQTTKSIIRYIERFSNDCGKTKTKAITLTNHNWNKQHYEPIIIPSNYLQLAQGAGKNHAYLVRLVLVLLLIGWKTGASLFSGNHLEQQSQPRNCFQQSFENCSINVAELSYISSLMKSDTVKMNTGN